ncbi:elongation factor 3 [Pacificimonas flava]|uniref:Elongation factor 3 n=2 Tax=Pacificimonas TaxID=1960290 RepID=A0A219B5X1_9SPHN|nr:MULTISPECIES: ABC-F family ATP-binding cassette domain-containing protein [Pacificimonas]MBZ6379096.1 ABC-F family ATP-binding cassette domain-containing protein [Pacificimonas aurantium]OWV33671.1 elongation factor 3 [Pacificimonas flava]
MSAPILSLESIGLVQGTGWLLRDLDLFIGERDRLALIGRNGAGKSTLFRIISGLVEIDEGKRKQRPGTKIAMLAQDPEISGFETLLDFATSGDDAPEKHEVEAIADQLGTDLSRSAQTASGGERRRAALCRILATDADLLLLDEPTNHLDIAAIEWLEGWLNRYAGAFIVISHDREFLKRLTRSVVWLDRGQIRRKEIGFGGFEAWSEEVYAEEARAAAKLDTKLAQETKWLHRGVTARRKRNQGRLDALTKLRAQRASMLGQAGKAQLDLADDEDAKAKVVIDAKDISKSFGDRQILKPMSLRIQRGDRIGLVGPNGAGKTTFLKLLTKELEPDTGRVRHAKTLSGILIDQQRSLLAPKLRVRDIVAEGGEWIDVRGETKHIVGYLKQFLFTREDADRLVGSMSGGERSRLLLAREFARPSNLLVLDEPTNDLDLETLDLLQEVIADYEGTVLLVSHDRDFLDRTVNMVIGLDGSGYADIVAGGFADWERKRRTRSQSGSKQSSGPPASAPQPSPAREERMTFKDKHELETLPARIADLERQVKIHETALADPKLYEAGPAAAQKLGDELERIREDLLTAEDRWLELSEKAEELAVQ